MTLRDFIPREHGAWAMWIVPMLSAALVTRFSISFLMLSISFALLYVVHHPIVMMVRKKMVVEGKDVGWAILIALPAVVLGLCLVIIWGRVWLLLFGAAEFGIFLSSIKAFVDRDQRSFRNEMTVVTALTLSAPIAYYTITGTLGTRGVLLYFLNFLFFGSSVFYVKSRIEYLREKGHWKGQARKALMMMIVYHLLLIAVIFAATATSLMSPWIALAFGPMLVQVVAGSLSKETAMNFKRLGMALVGQSAAFLAVLALFLV